MTIEDIHSKIDKDWSKHLQETRKLLRIPSVSMTGEGIQDTADFLENVLAEMGAKHGQFKAKKDGHPLVHGYLDAGSDVTGLVYGMYDVQPIGNLDEWDYPPFGATIVKQKPFGEVLINRGAYNSKAALGGSLLAVRSMLDAEMLPINLHFLLEGEEELGGRSFPDFVIKNKTKLRKADGAFGLDFSQNIAGTPSVTLGLKGCVYFDLIAEGKTRGGPEAELHSSDAVIVESPVWRLVHAISTMVDENQDPAIDGLSEQVLPPGKIDIELAEKLAASIDVDNYMKELGVKRFKIQGTKEEVIKKYLFEPSVNIDGLSAGFEEDGTKTVLPPCAKAKIDIRIVPNMTIKDTHAKVMAHLKKRGFTDIRMRNYEDYPWSKTDADSSVSMACVEAMRYHGYEPDVWPTVAGSAPFYVFDQVLGIPWGYTGLGFGGKAHSPNEFCTVKGMKDYEKSVATIFCKFKELAGDK
ncbi:MAG: hypothetical protein A3K76_02760 [Euryarchaeota archaeon RBG_13_57_23]|nr:MAG: hypothetical protein A3K76_02760 [Euryarchaeota archaeon RBG_13_57_23]